LFYGEYAASIAAQKAADLNVDFVPAKYFGEYNLYVYTSNVNIMEHISTVRN
jgi:hypothetical protein